MEQNQLRLLFLYEFKLNHRATTAAHNINTAFGEGTTTERTAQNWFKKFREGEFELEDKPRSGRTPAIDDDQFKAAVKEDPQQTLKDLAARFGVSETTVKNHMDKIDKVKKLDKWVSHKKAK